MAPNPRPPRRPRRLWLARPHRRAATGGRWRLGQAPGPASSGRRSRMCAASWSGRRAMGSSAADGPGGVGGAGGGVSGGEVRVLCVDDNDFIAEAMRRMLKPSLGFRWMGWLPDSDGLIEAVGEKKPDVVLLD